MTKYQLPIFEDKSLLPTGKSHVSYSEIADFETCSYKHRLKHIEKINLGKPSIHTEYGQVIHDVLENYILGKHELNAETAAAAKVQFRDHCDKLKSDHGIDITDKDFEDFAASIPEILKSVPEFMNETFPGWTGFAAEHALYESVAGQTNKYFKGFIDTVIRMPKNARKKRSSETNDNNSIMRLSELVKQTKSETDIEFGDGYEYYIIDWKGQRLNAPILTPYGWTTMGSLKIGDEITDSSGGICKVGGIYPLGKKDVYRLTMRDGGVVECTDDHLWKVARAGEHEYKILTTKELIEKPKYRYLPVISAPVQYKTNNQEISVNPYLLGVLLGDGGLTSSVSFSSADEEIIEYVRQALPDTLCVKKVGKTSKYHYAIVLKNKNRNFRYAKGCHQILNFLREEKLLGKKSHEKHIPKAYLMTSPEDRLLLLQGLLDTDGWVQKGHAKFSTTSTLLARDIRELAGSLGGVVFSSVRKKKRSPNEHVENILTIKMPPNLIPFRLSRKVEKYNTTPVRYLRRSIAKIEKIGEDDMQCIGVTSSDHLYVTSDFILTHNTTSWGWDAAKKRDFHKQLQLALYKHYFCRISNLRLDQVKCGFVLLKRTPRKSDKSRCELVPVSVGPKTEARALEVLNNMINQVASGRAIKNRNSCRYCEYNGTEHCT
jgi:intein/homing endonuclease